MKSFFLLLFSLIVFGFASSQNFEYDVAVNSVTFSGDNMYAIHKDDAYAYINNDYNWKDDGTTIAAAFPSGAYIQATATLTLTCANMPTDIYVRGTGPEGINFPSQHAAVGGSTITYPATASVIPFEENKVRYFEHFTIQWEISFDTIHWYAAGSSDSRVYVTWHDAATESPGTYGEFKYFLSVFHIACKNADGATTEEEIVEKVWSDFVDHSVLNYYDLPLHYYKDIYTFNVFLYTLLKDRDGECYTWAQLFLAALKINGISYPNNYLNITAAYMPNECGTPSASGFLVKTWTFVLPPAGNCDFMPYTNIWDYPSETDTSYLFMYEEVVDEPGILGQTAANPASVFGNHQLAIIGDKIYDPCYGVIYNSVDEIYENALSGWWYYDYGPESFAGIDINGDGDLDDDPWFNIFRLTDDVHAGEFDIYITSW